MMPLLVGSVIATSLSASPSGSSRSRSDDALLARCCD
jgi:hypothetical protein